LQSVLQWTCEIKCEGVSITSPSKVNTYNICDFMNPISTSNTSTTEASETKPELCSERAPFLRAGSNFRFNPSVFKGMESTESIKRYLIEKCREAGFKCEFHTKKVRPRATHKSPSKTCTIDFTCAHNKKSYETIKVSKNTIRPGAQSRRPIEEKDRCPFKFTIFCQKDDSLWYLSIKPNQQSNAGLHCGHVPQLPSLVSNVHISEIDKNMIDIAVSMHKKGLDFSKITDILNENYMKGPNASTIAPSQIRHLVTNTMTDSVCTNFSSAEQLLHTFDSIKNDDPDFQYVALIHSCDEGYKLQFPHGRPKKIKDNDTSIDLIRSSMKIEDSEDVLLAVSWVSKSEIDLLTRFPSVIVVDVTEKTNREKRGLFVATGIDGNNKIFPTLHSFMPNAKMNSFAWIYNHAIPELWPKECIERCEVMITDGEHSLYAPIENMIRMNTDWKNLHLYRYVTQE
jgi:hypothetical protein